MPLCIVLPALRRWPGFGAAIVFPGSQRAIALIFLCREELAGQIGIDKEKGMCSEIVGHDATAESLALPPTEQTHWPADMQTSHRSSRLWQTMGWACSYAYHL